MEWKDLPWPQIKLSPLLIDSWVFVNIMIGTVFVCETVQLCSGTNAMLGISEFAGLLIVPECLDADFLVLCLTKVV